MRLVVTDGSGTRAATPGLSVGGKTGTAEYGEGDPLPTHAWFIGFADNLGVAVFVEGGGVGGRDAAPIAGRLFAGLPWNAPPPGRPAGEAMTRARRLSGQ